MNAMATVQLLLGDTGWNHMGGGAWVFMGLGMIIFWGLVIFGVVWLVRTLTEHRAHPAHQGPQASPLENLDRKLAEGALSVEEYQERRRLLSRD